MSMTVRCLLVIIPILGVMYCQGEPRYEQNAMNKVGDGQQMLTQIRQYGEHPRYGRCWTTALEQINEGCKRLTDDEQSYLALSFANCHLEKASQPTYPCDSAQDIRKCLKQLEGSPIAFNAYTEFFTHTQDICFFLQSQVWHEQTEETVSRLARSSEDVAVKMEAAGQLQEEMIEKQGASIKQQELILKNEEKLRDALQTSSQDIKNVFAEMKESTQTQKLLFEETFSRVGDIQRVILGEFSWFNSLLFFAAAVLIAYVVTSTPRTSGARFWLFIILTVDWVVERAIFQIDGTDQTLLYEHMWFCRKLFSVVAILVLCLCAYRYKDLATANNALLLEIRRQNLELCRALKGNGFSSHPALANNGIAAGIQSTGSTALSVAAGHKSLLYGHDYSDSTPGAECISAVDAYSSEDFTSSESDPTFVGSVSSEEVSDTESFCTASQPSRPVSPRTSLDQWSSTPHPSAENSFIQTDGSYGGSSSTAKRKRGRPKGSKSRQSTPQGLSTTMSSQTRYNLRTRTPQSANNSILNSETVEMFIERMGAVLGQRHYRAERVDPAKYSQRRNITSFSSDDEF